MVKKIFLIILLVVCIVFLVVFLPKLLSSLLVIIAALTGKLKATPYESGRLAGQAVAMIIVFGVLVFIFISILKALKKK
jgi:hypothetical protein